MALLWANRQARQTFSSATKNRNSSTSSIDHQRNSSTLMTRSPYSTMKMIAMHFFPTSTPFNPLYASPMKRNSITPSPSQMRWLKDVTLNYRKPTFTGQYLRWNSFSPNKRKINLIGTLVHRAFKICSKGKLDAELDKILSILLENGYPENLIKSTIKQKLQQLNLNPVKFEKQITSAVKRCFFSVEPRVVFTTRQQQRKTCYLPIIKTT